MKIIVGNQNTKWGVIIKPSSSNIYRHILSFDTQALKDEFINDYIFPNKDYKKLLNDSIDRADAYDDSMHISFRVDRKSEYPNETIESMLNKDICATMDVDGNIKFWAITGAKHKGSEVIEYTAEVDIFFTYDIKKMFGGQTMIKQAMIDRYKISPHDQNVLQYSFYNPSPEDGRYNVVDYTSQLFNNEEFDNIKPDALVQKEKTQLIGYDFKSHIISNVPDETKERVSNLLNNLVWNTMAVANSDEPKFNHFGNSKVPYYTVLWADEPIGEGVIEVVISKYDGPKGNYKNKLSVSTKNPDIFKLLKVPTALKSSRQMSIVSPLVQHGMLGMSADGLKGGEIVVTTHADNIIIDKIEINLYSADNSQIDIANINVSSDKDNPDNMQILVVKEHGGHFNENIWNQKHGFSLYQNNFYKPMGDPPLLAYLKDISPWEPESEVKAKFAPYRQLELKGISNNTFYYEPQYLSAKPLRWNIFNSYELSMSQVAIQSLNYKDIYEFPTTKENKYFLDQAGYNMPTTSTDYDEFNARHKEQFSSGLFSSGLKAGIGGLIAAGSAAASGGLTAIAGGASLAFSSGMEIKQQLAQKEDMKNAPAHVNNASTTFMFDKFLKDPHYKLTMYGLPPVEELLIQQHFFKYGYNLKNRIVDINKYLNTRYRFNYIEAPETYENIKLQVSAEVKQIIDGSIAEGLTIWHYRRKDKFKGIKEYTFNNPEMSIYNAN